MTQHHLERAIARATGESVSTIRRLGFGLANGLTRPQRLRSGRTVPAKGPRRATA